MEGIATKTTTAIVTGILTVLFGGWDMALEIMLIIMTLDYLTGVLSAFKTQTVSSSTGYMGIMKKVCIFIVIALAAQMDKMTGNDSKLFRNCTAFFFIANDALSILENVGEIGIKLPSFLRAALIKLRNTNSNLPESDGKNLDETEHADLEQGKNGENQ